MVFNALTRWPLAARGARVNSEPRSTLSNRLRWLTSRRCQPPPHAQFSKARKKANDSFFIGKVEPLIFFMAFEFVLRPI
jgi:hypothetical protein